MVNDETCQALHDAPQAIGFAPIPGRVVILGGGSTGEHFAGALRDLDATVTITLVERELVGGECSYWACMPTKAMLRPLEVLAAARLAPGAVAGAVEPSGVFHHRDETASHRDDSSQEAWLAEHDVELVRGTARVAEPGIVEVAGGRRLSYDKLVVATGSSPIVPPIAGLQEAGYWTNREATETQAVPESIVVIGAGPVGCELAQFFHRVGSSVVLVDTVERLLPREDAEAGLLLRAHFEEEGIDIRCGTRAERVEPGLRVHLENGDVLEAERLLVAAGRRGNTHGLGLERVGVTVGERGVVVDERMRAAEGVWAIGDVTAIAMLTHVGKYHARVAAADIAGREARADHRAVPAVTFTDPQVASVGRPGGEGLVTGSYRVDCVARTATYERPTRRGLLKLFADPERRVLVGAVAVGPEAGEWLGQLTLAVKAEIPIDVLRDTIQPYPTFSEGVFLALKELDL